MARVISNSPADSGEAGVPDPVFRRFDRLVKVAVRQRNVVLVAIAVFEQSFGDSFSKSPHGGDSARIARQHPVRHQRRTHRSLQEAAQLLRVVLCERRKVEVAD